MEDTEKRILKTINWFDMFDFPLKKEEIRYYILGGSDSLDVSISSLLEKGEIHEKDGRFFLPGREEIIKTREERYIESLRKLKILDRAIQAIKFFPFVRAVFACNVLGYLNAKSEDDIDLLVVTSKGKIWTARWFLTGMAKVLGLRPRVGGRIKDKLCFSFYLSEDNLNLEYLKFEEDPYLIWWFMGLMPLYDREGLAERFLKSNGWVERYLKGYPDWIKKGMDRSHLEKETKASVLVKKALEILFFWGEKILKAVQLKIMPKNLKIKANQSAGVMVNDKILKLHLNDRREEFRREFERRTENI